MDNSTEYVRHARRSRMSHSALFAGDAGTVLPLTPATSYLTMQLDKMKLDLMRPAAELKLVTRNTLVCKRPAAGTEPLEGPHR